MKMFKSGTPADIISGYVSASPLSFYLTADDIIFLQQQGVSADLIRAMMHRSVELQQQRMSAMAATASVPMPSAPPPLQYYNTTPGAYPYEAAPYPVYAPYNYDTYSYLWYPLVGWGGYGYNRGFRGTGFNRVNFGRSGGSVHFTGGAHIGGVTHFGGGGGARVAMSGHASSGGHGGRR
jgi:hypothetical protein